MPKNKFVIIDAMSLAYKAYYAFMTRPLITKKGEPTSATYGFLAQLLKILEDHKPDYIAVAFDSKEKTFRHEKYEHYKANRSEMPEDMIPQIKRIKEIINILNIPVFILPGWEADDLIGTLACKAEGMGLESYIITPDKDFNQLLSENIKIVRPGKGIGEIIVMDKDKFKEDFGFEPKYMVDYLALIGDASDNIPGVKGIGEKTAKPLIEKYGTIEEIYNHIDEITKPAVKSKLESCKDEAFMSKELAHIDCNAEIDLKIEVAKVTQPDFDSLRDLFLELEFKTLFARFLNIYKPENLEINLEEIQSEPKVVEEVKVYSKDRVNYTLITSIEDAKALSQKLSNSSLFAFDTETDSLNTFTCKLAGVSFCLNQDEAYFVGVEQEASGLNFNLQTNDRLSLEDFISIFKKPLENENIKKICHNAKFDFSVLKSNGIDVKGLYFDTMLASYIIDPDQKHGMDELSIKYLNYRPISLTSLIGLKKDAQNILNVNLDDLACYSCEDADITFKLYEIFNEKLEKNNLEKLAHEVEFPLAPVLEDVERTGIKVDKEGLRLLSKDLQILLDEYTRKIYNCCGEEFNINSPVQLQKILYDKLGLNTGRKTKTGFSTDARALENLLGQHEVIEIIQQYRQISKLITTYADALPKLINKETGRIHTSFNQAAVSTGRLSSTNPNLQNIPIRSESGKEIRKAFIPRNDDYVILSADYSQIELRIMASISGDPALINAFRNNEDIHRSTAALVFMVPPEEVTAEMRRRAKEVNFGILYGIGAFGLKTRLGVTQTHAKEIIDTYFSTFTKVREFINNSIYKAQQNGYSETLLGRRRFLKNIRSKNNAVRQFEERVAVNMPIQGTAADMIKLAMINIHKELNRRNAKTKMVLQVHDELVFDAHKDEVDELIPVIKSLMENALPMEVPIVAETGTGVNWLDAH